RIGGVICAGTILYEAGGEYYLDVLSHKSAYNDIGLGTLCCYLSICECIRRDGKAYHFLWGRYDYKLRLGGIERPLSNVMLYRSRQRMLLHPGLAVTHFAQGELLRLRRHMRERMEQDHAVTRLVRRLTARLRQPRAEA